MVPTYKVNLRKVHFARRRERNREGERERAPRFTEPKALLPNPRKMLKKKSQNISATGIFSRLVEKLPNARARGVLESPNAIIPL